MNNVNISVILPIYGVEKYIERSLLSLFNQTKTEGVEYILVNDCTKDDSMSIAKQVIDRYPSLNIKVINHEINKGLASSRQTGYEASSGEYILHLDSDDWFEPSMLEDLYNAAILSRADVIVCDFYRDYNECATYNKQIVDSDPIQFYESILFSRAVTSVWNKMVKRSIIVNNNIISVPNINMGEDQIFSAQLFCRAKPSIFHLKRAYVHYCIRATSYTGSFYQRRLDDSINGQILIDDLISKENLTSRFEKGMAVKKLRIKLYALCNTTGADREQYLKLYPETDKYILSHTPAKLPYRLALYEACNGRMYVLNMLVFLLKLLKK